VKFLLLVLISATALLALAACGGETSTESSAAGETSTENGTAETTVPFDRAFIDAMVVHHQDAIAAANGALSAGLSQPDLVGIATAISATQQEEVDQMLAWREEWFGSRELSPSALQEIGMSMEAMGMQHDPADLATADDVDSAFATMMVDHHNGAIAMAQLALERSDRSEIHELARAIIDAQQREVDLMMPHVGMSGMDHG
jgi:uncharacterized protein (DUF305 family)